MAQLGTRERETHLLNSLGSSECGVYCHLVLNSPEPFVDSTVSVGYLVDHKEVTVLDENNQAIDVDRIGQIAVTSSYLSSGYWKDEALNSEKFKAGPTPETATF